MIRALLLLLLVTGCGRALTPAERAFAYEIHGQTVNLDRVRFYDGAPTRAVTFKRAARPRVTCRERIWPPIEEKVVTTKPIAVVLFNAVLFDEDWYLDDYLPEYPDQLGLVAAMLFAHELTHIWQWQNRERTGYHPLKAAAEHRLPDPYLFDVANSQAFLDYGYEQQASIVEEFVCCRALAPKADRTQRLHALIAQEMPVAPLPSAQMQAVRLPWDGVELRGICD